MIKILGRFKLLTILAAVAAVLIVPGAAKAENVIFEDSFQRADSGSTGSVWQEYRVRRDENGAIPVPGDTPWSFKGGTLYFEAVGENKYIEDFVQTTVAFPVDNTRVEFEIRATGGTRLGYIGPVALWAGPVSGRRDAHNITATGVPMIGVQAWYRWENGGTRGMWIHGINRYGDHPQLLYSGLNQGGFAKHIITIQGGKLTYQSPDCPVLTYDLAKPLEPEAKRYFSFGARLYDRGVKQTIEIKNFKITSLDKKEEDKLGEEARKKLDEGMQKLAESLKKQVHIAMVPLVNQIISYVQPKIAGMGPQISSMLDPMISQTLNEIQAQAQAQFSTGQKMMQQIPTNIQMPSGYQIPPGMQIPTSMNTPGMYQTSQAYMQAAYIPPRDGLLAQAGSGTESMAPSQEQIMNMVIEQVSSQVQTQMQSQMQVQMQSMKPQIEAMVKTMVDPMMVEIKTMSESHAQSVVSDLNTYVESNIAGIIAGVMPMLPPEVQKLPAAEVDAMLRKEIVDGVKPQINAMIEEEVSSVVRSKILLPIQEQVENMAKEQIKGASPKILAMIDEVFAGQPAFAALTPEIKKIVGECISSIDAYIQSDVQEKFKNSAPGSFLIKVMVDGKPVSYDVIPMIKEGRTLVPLRAIAETMGAEVKWNENDQSISLAKGKTSISLGVGNKCAYVNNNPVKLDVPATTVNGRTLVPARFISESLGAQVKWDDYSKTASIVSH